MIYFNKKVIIRIKFECIRVAHEKNTFFYFLKKFLSPFECTRVRDGKFFLKNVFFLYLRSKTKIN